jgi:hypothetical protein
MGDQDDGRSQDTLDGPGKAATALQPRNTATVPLPMRGQPRGVPPANRAVLIISVVNGLLLQVGLLLEVLSRTLDPGLRIFAAGVLWQTLLVATLLVLAGTALMLPRVSQMRGRPVQPIMIGLAISSGSFLESCCLIFLH